MKVVTNASELPSACAFVPTMGALHAGHASLFTLAKKYSENVVASIFVNPLQFENQEDLAQYPRTPDIDIEIAAASGVTHLWLPSQSEIYPGEFTKHSAGPIGDIYEGKSRPGHFDGVLTVVRRLFDLVNPKFAIFGEKDFQQLQLIKRIAGSVEIITAPTIRESDGLALSSRNIRLSAEGRVAASVIYRALTQATTEDELRAVLRSESSLTLDYADFIDETTFTHAQTDTQNVRAVVAGWINGVRLIDNIPMGNRA
ncbi:PanC Panthothenate synthetase [Candidatus Nanopelagicaceae bacterium]